ncbi:Tn3 family transposase [Streptomyces sp. NBC_01669]|uniref:Tn3 family transposase n=1 Tax=Streptomyces sp. NBC_01669 TaxID=2975909 RepID=UPI00225485A0|nr:Tn3 family transposase [Streptomyces sp. NBC_01669]MCX4538569.1 Tn3 family transposase [Streptomyces sp. NBC_01669]
MLPRVDFPELLLEVAELTSMADAFTHISGADSGMEGFTTSLCAVLLSEACDVGLTSVIKPDVPALTPGLPGPGRPHQLPGPVRLHPAAGTGPAAAACPAHRRRDGRR